MIAEDQRVHIHTYIHGDSVADSSSELLESLSFLSPLVCVLPHFDLQRRSAFCRARAVARDGATLDAAGQKVTVCLSYLIPKDRSTSATFAFELLSLTSETGRPVGV